jgi:hypothetical protein
MGIAEQYSHQPCFRPNYFDHREYEANAVRAQVRFLKLLLN